eukprot:COSAG01_NODE_2559_length_7453_cov_37.838183_5_plen_951_part_00
MTPAGPPACLSVRRFVKCVSLQLQLYKSTLYKSPSNRSPSPMLRLMVLALTAPLVSAAALENHGVTQCTAAQCCETIVTGQCTGNTCDNNADPIECRGRIEPDIDCSTHPFLKTAKPAGTMGRTFAECCKSMCSTYDRCNENDEIDSNMYGYTYPPGATPGVSQGNGWEADIVKGARSNPVAVDGGTALGNEPRYYFNKYTHSTARVFKDSTGVTAQTVNAPTCPVADVEYQVATAKTTCCASVCQNFRLITTVGALQNGKYASIRHGPALSSTPSCTHPHAATNNHDSTSTGRYTTNDPATECAGTTCTLAECCTAVSLPTPTPTPTPTPAPCVWSTTPTVGLCGAAVTAPADGARAIRMCGSGGKQRTTATLVQAAATGGTCTLPAGTSADTAYNSARSYTITTPGYRIYKDEDCCLVPCGTDCVGGMQDTGCSHSCGSQGNQQEKFVASTAYVAGKIACTGTTVTVGSASATCTNGYRDAQTCANVYPSLPTGTITPRNKSPFAACNRVECCSTWLASGCGAAEDDGPAALSTYRGTLTSSQGCCNVGYHPGGTQTAGVQASNAQCCVADKSNKCFSGNKPASQTESNTVAGVQGGVARIDDVVCPTGWPQRTLDTDAACKQPGPNRVVNDAGAYINVYACCVAPEVADTAATEEFNTNSWCKGTAGIGQSGYNGRNNVWATTSAVQGSYVSNHPLNYVCPTTHSLKDFMKTERVPNTCAEECIVRTDAWMDCVSSPAQTIAGTCGNAGTTWYGLEAPGNNNIGGLDGTGTYGANCPHTPNPCKCQSQVNAMYAACKGCTTASYTIGTTVGSTWGPGGKQAFENTFEVAKANGIGAHGKLVKGTSATGSLWTNGAESTSLVGGVTITNLHYMIEDPEADHDSQSYGGQCTVPTLSCSHTPEVGTKEVTVVSQCEGSAAPAGAVLKAAGAYASMPTVAAAFLAAAAAL